MNKVFKFIPIILLIFALLSFSLSYKVGSEFVHSRGVNICLSCMGLEEHENF